VSIIVAGVLAALAGTAIAMALRPIRAARRAEQLARIQRDFHRQREQLEAKFIDRAAATLIVSGVAAAREALLTVKLPHAAVAPSELQVWSLAWFDALNRMPNASEASPRGTSGRCIADALRGIVEAAPPGAPGKPVLPSVASVADGSVSVALTPSVACPWNTDTLKAGADNALRAVARQAAWSGLQPVVETSPE
jgi:hypothetical protein